ncbi:hypothetical protein FisN_16Hu027 [Fistulifera solaris]|uniref:DUF6824 domain-containing protein n=1 Tax=Fistulifera solaris TaxID=1519565 RepID=A0A1Z5KG10_FISSO|nr:hypothetical protein FisN_16Hu027 [Fistulifera solaris]|eukprot:GAX25189.1 hypothetical protein FisN_16Hu027 [Fistulifera solaris]
MKCKPDVSIDQVKAKRQSEDDEDSYVAMDSSVVMVEEMLSSEYDTEEDGNLPAEHAPHPAPQPAEQDPHPAPQSAKRWNDYPLKDITEPHEHDVLCGRGGHSNNHKGNKNFREMVEGFKKEYIGLIKMDKTKLAEYIVDAWRDQDPPGRFLKKDEAGKWYEVGDDIARGKTSQALREKKPTKGKRFDVGDKKALEPKQDEFGEFEKSDEAQFTPFGEEANSLNDELGLHFDREESFACDFPSCSTLLCNDNLVLTPGDVSSCYIDSSENSDESPRGVILTHDLLERDMSYNFGHNKAFEEDLDWEVSCLKRKSNTGLQVDSTKRKPHEVPWRKAVMLKRVEPALDDTHTNSMRTMDEEIRVLSLELEKKASLL